MVFRLLWKKSKYVKKETKAGEKFSGDFKHSTPSFSGDFKRSTSSMFEHPDQALHSKVGCLFLLRGGLKSVFGNSETMAVNFCTSSFFLSVQYFRWSTKLNMLQLWYAHLLKLSVSTGCTISVCLLTIPVCAKIEKSAVNCNYRNLCTFSPKTCPDQTPVFRLFKYFQSEWQIRCHFYFLIWISSQV